MLMVESDDEGNITHSGIAEDDKTNEGKCRGIVKYWVTAMVDGGIRC